VKCIHHGLVTKRGAVLAALLLGVVAGVQAEQQFENFGYQGQGFFVTGDYASSRQDANGGGLPSANGSGGSLVMGYEKAFSEQLFGGVTLGYGNAPFDLGNGQGSVKYDEWALSAFAAHRFGAFYASALATYVAMVTTFGPSVLRSFLVRTEEVSADCLA
jgi:hypothetical protein